MGMGVQLELWAWVFIVVQIFTIITKKWYTNIPK